MTLEDIEHLIVWNGWEKTETLENAIVYTYPPTKTTIQLPIIDGEFKKSTLEAILKKAGILK